MDHGYVAALNASSGEGLWAESLGRSAHPKAVMGDGTVFMAGYTTESTTLGSGAPIPLNGKKTVLHLSARSPSPHTGLFSNGSQEYYSVPHSRVDHGSKWNFTIDNQTEWCAEWNTTMVNQTAWCAEWNYTMVNQTEWCAEWNFTMVNQTCSGTVVSERTVNETCVNGSMVNGTAVKDACVNMTLVNGTAVKDACVNLTLVNGTSIVDRCVNLTMVNGTYVNHTYPTTTVKNWEVIHGPFTAAEWNVSFSAAGAYKASMACTEHMVHTSSCN